MTGDEGSPGSHPPSHPLRTHDGEVPKLDSPQRALGRVNLASTRRARDEKGSLSPAPVEVDPGCDRGSVVTLEFVNEASAMPPDVKFRYSSESALAPSAMVMRPSGVNMVPGALLAGGLVILRLTFCSPRGTEHPS